MADSHAGAPHDLFELSAEYDAMLNAGIRLSGESADYFVRGRIDDMIPRVGAPRRILDFGCGIGRACAYLAERYPDAEIVGADTAENAIAHATSVYGSERVSFCRVSDLPACPAFDLCHVNGVFHHIAPADRPDALRRIYRSLVPGGKLALCENNPWNPGTRMVMARIPFDRDAIMISPPELRGLLGASGFQVVETRSLFYFPRSLRPLRRFEPTLAGLPLGAQYYVLATT
jgi:SAM-dependent methyltransferase